MSKCGRTSTCRYCGDEIEHNHGLGLPWWSHVGPPGCYGRIYCGAQYGRDKGAEPIEGEECDNA